MGLEYDKEIDERLRLFRKTLGMKQGPFASSIGIQGAQLSRIENGTNRVTIPILVKLIDVYSINPYWLLKGVGEQTTSHDFKLDLSEDLVSVRKTLENAQKKLEDLEKKQQS